MQALGMATENCRVIPIGSYGQLYPDTTTRAAARQKLAIADNEFVILFFGIISPYKGTEELIEAFSHLSLPKARLVIVGQVRDQALKQRLQQAAQMHSQIDFYEGFVADDEVATYFKAADIVCLPFQAITTSSSVMLALGFGKPVVAPRLGVLRDLPASIGYFYSPTKPDGLEKSLLRAATQPEKLAAMGRRAKNYSDSLSWESIADQTLQVYSDLWKQLVAGQKTAAGAEERRI